MRLDAVAPNMTDTVAAIVELLTEDGYCVPPVPISSEKPKATESASTSVADESGTSKYSLRSTRQSPYRAPAGASVVPVRRPKAIEEEPVEIQKHIGACFVAHSLGTAVVSWMLHSKQHKHLVATSVLIDPVTFLLCIPKVCASFVHPDPKCVSTYLSSFLLAKELYISNALSRHFNWSWNAVFLEDLPGAWEKEEFAENDLTPRYVAIESEARNRKLRTTVSTNCSSSITTSSSTSNSSSSCCCTHFSSFSVLF
jgi:hypothetical protein